MYPTVVEFFGVEIVFSTARRMGRGDKPYCRVWPVCLNRPSIGANLAWQVAKIRE
jgi:hypothetical protein